VPGPLGPVVSVLAGPAIELAAAVEEELRQLPVVGNVYDVMEDGIALAGDVKKEVDEATKKIVSVVGEGPTAVANFVAGMFVRRRRSLDLSQMLKDFEETVAQVAQEKVENDGKKTHLGNTWCYEICCARCWQRTTEVLVANAIRLQENLERGT